MKFIQEEFLHDKIIPMKLPKNIPDGYKDKYGKFDYVRNWLETMQDRIAFSIYGGNGFNDTQAMEYIKKNKMGFVICPENSHPDVKKIADYVSEEHAADGIKRGIDYINELLRKKGEKGEQDEKTKVIADNKSIEEVHGDTQADETGLR